MEVVNPITDIIDECVYTSNGWMQYGSDKGTESSNAYQVKYVVNKDNEIRTYKKDNKNLVELFSLRNKMVPTDINQKGLDIVEKIKNKEFEIGRNKNAAQQKKKEKKQKRKAERKYNDVVDKDLIKELVHCLNPIRATEYKTWSELCWCLKSIDDGLFELFDEFSKKSDKYNDSCVEKFWDTAKEGNYTIGTLRFWAKNDNKDKYFEICEKYRKYDIQDFNFKGGITHFSLAEVFVNEYTDKYIFNKNEIFVYHNDIWDNSLSEALIQDDLVNMIGKLCKIATRTQDKEDLPDIFKKFSSITTRNNRDKIVKDIKDKLLIKNNNNILINNTLDQKKNNHFRNEVMEKGKN